MLHGVELPTPLHRSATGYCLLGKKLKGLVSSEYPFVKSSLSQCPPPVICYQVTNPVSIFQTVLVEGGRYRQHVADTLACHIIAPTGGSLLNLATRGTAVVCVDVTVVTLQMECSRGRLLVVESQASAAEAKAEYST